MPVMTDVIQNYRQFKRRYDRFDDESRAKIIDLYRYGKKLDKKYHDNFWAIVFCLTQETTRQPIRSEEDYEYHLWLTLDLVACFKRRLRAPVWVVIQDWMYQYHNKRVRHYSKQGLPNYAEAIARRRDSVLQEGQGHME